MILLLLRFLCCLLFQNSCQEYTSLRVCNTEDIEYRLEMKGKNACRHAESTIDRVPF
jgi:hypothetical protein